MSEIALRTYITTEAKAWLHRRDGSSEVIRVIAVDAPAGQQWYDLINAYGQVADYLGRILFDKQGFWIYDGAELAVDEQEQLAAFIMNYKERV